MLTCDEDTNTGTRVAHRHRRYWNWDRWNCWDQQAMECSSARVAYALVSHPHQWAMPMVNVHNLSTALQRSTAHGADHEGVARSAAAGYISLFAPSILLLSWSICWRIACIDSCISRSNASLAPPAARIAWRGDRAVGGKWGGTHGLAPAAHPLSRSAHRSHHRQSARCPASPRTMSSGSSRASNTRTSQSCRHRRRCPCASASCPPSAPCARCRSRRLANRRSRRR